MLGVSSQFIHPSRFSLWNALLLGAGLVLLFGVTPEVQAQERPVGVSDSLIARGERIFQGAANCASCHADAGRGTDVAPALDDDEWSRGEGSYEEIVERIMHGVSRQESRTDTPMPMRGWTGLSDEDVKAVAAYVWSLSREPQESE